MATSAPVGTASAAPAAGTNPFDAVIAEADEFATRLAKRLLALQLPTETVVALARQALAPLERLQGIEASVRIAEDAARATDRVRELLKSPGVGSDATAAPVAAASAPTASTTPRELTTDDRTQLTLRLLRAKREGPDRYAAELVAVKAETGLNGRAVAACLARTNGKFKDGFVRRILQPLRGDARKAQAAELEQLGFGSAKQLLGRVRR